ncbi:hypothetical protein Bca52824_007029 [Brassica carinata]|uniref:Uncharacterized protein n=1 Tax=Brassica carinata TaxID=52824 RepID=A0A8X7W6Q8_BRACI|nr:hypothetical protein Bca52824_007029 [Brassica carinata]
MGLDYSYSQPSESEDLFGNSVDSGESETDDLIRRDQAEISYNARSLVHYPPQPRLSSNPTENEYSIEDVLQILLYARDPLRAKDDCARDPILLAISLYKHKGWI